MRLILLTVVCLSLFTLGCSSQDTPISKDGSIEKPRETKTAVMNSPSFETHYFENGCSVLTHPNYLLDGPYMGLGSYGWSGSSDRLSLEEREIMTRYEIEACLNDPRSTYAELKRWYEYGHLVGFHSLGVSKECGPNPKVKFFPNHHSEFNSQRFYSWGVSGIDEEVRTGVDKMINDEDLAVVYVAIGVHEDLWRSAEVYYFEKGKVVFGGN